MSYLRRFPFDRLKIDKSFVEDIDHDEDSRAITEATLKLAKALNMRCTAEGVETESQKQFLTDIGCDELQGYLFSRPQPLEKLGHLFAIAPEENRGAISAAPIQNSKELQADAIEVAPPSLRVSAGSK